MRGAGRSRPARPADDESPQLPRNKSWGMPAAAKIWSREASSCRRSCGRSTSSSRPFHLRTLPATITVSTLLRSISETTAPGTWLSGATLSAVASRMMMSASLPGVREPVLRSSRLDRKTGSLTPGKEDDIIILDATALNVAPLNQVPGAVVSLMDRSNVETVIVAGKVRKWKGRLLDVDLPQLRRQLEASRDHIFAAAGIPQDLFRGN